MNPYETCPVLENEHYLLRLVNLADATDLLSVYSDKDAVPYFNSDNCHGDNFHYTSPERIQEAISFWKVKYQQKQFVRFTIVDKGADYAIGTIELFCRIADDYFTHCGLLRLDLRSDYERFDVIQNIPELFMMQHPL